MRSAAAAEASSVDKPAPTPAATKRTAAKKPAPRKRAAPVARPTPAVEPAPPPPTVERRSARRLGAAVVVAALVGVVLVLVVRALVSDDTSSASGADMVTRQELASFASTQATPVYWAGERRARTLELTTTQTGVFVRYLPGGVAAGSPERVLTVATYPMRDAYSTAEARSEQTGMSSRPTRDGGLAVWKTAQPTSVYLAWRGVPSLVEIYAPGARDARSTALSGSVRPVR